MLLEMQPVSSEGVIVLDGGNGDGGGGGDGGGDGGGATPPPPRWDFIQEGSDAAEQERILAILKSSPVLKSDGARSRAAQHGALRLGPCAQPP